MALEAKCPKCAIVFDPSMHRASATQRMKASVGAAGPAEQPSADASRVKCPKCGHEFFSVSMRVFVGPRVVMAVAIAALLAVGILLAGHFFP
jgi:phage FluMu protein Com